MELTRLSCDTLDWMLSLPMARKGGDDVHKLFPRELLCEYQGMLAAGMALTFPLRWFCLFFFCFFLYGCMKNPS